MYAVSMPSIVAFAECQAPDPIVGLVIFLWIGDLAQLNCSTIGLGNCL
jgi:hypothetical protein